MTKRPHHPPRTTLHDSLADIERVASHLADLVPALRRAEDQADALRRPLAHEAVAQVEISLTQLRDVAVRLDAAKSLVRSSTTPPWQ